MTQSTSPDFEEVPTAQASANLAQSALQAGDLETALRIADEAVASGLRHPLLFNLAAHTQERRQRYAEAIELLKQGLELDPNDLSMLTAFGLCLNKLAQPARALAAFEAVLAIDPDHAPAHYGKGAAFNKLGDFEAARRHYRAASELPPPYADPFGALAALDARVGNYDDARGHAEQALRIDPGNVAGRTALAICENEAKRFVEAERLARELAADPALGGDERGAAEIVLGDALDGQGRVDEAFAAYGRGKALQRAVVAPHFERPGLETYPQFLERLAAWGAALPQEGFKAAPGADDSAAAGHVFLMGFARSGTTLMETALAGHPDVAALDERDSLRTAASGMLESDASLDRLASLDEAEARRMRDRYWGRVAQHGADVRGKVFVDKAPFAASMLPVIAALFPKAKILFAVRDPRDVVLSCFRRDFNMNPTTYQFATLESTVRCYDGLMRVAALFLEKLPLSAHRLVYERLTEDFEEEAGRACAFVGLEWNAAMADVAATASARPSHTPSASQLVRGLYQGEGQWRAYARHFEPIMPILQPWIERYGYAED